MAWLIANWRVVLSVALAAGTFSAGYFKGSDSVKRDWEIDIHLRMKEQLAAAEKNQKLLVALEETKNANLKTIDSLRRQLAVVSVRVPAFPCIRHDPTGGIQNPATGTGILPATPEKPIGEAGSNVEPAVTAQAAFDTFAAGAKEDAAEADSLLESCRVVMDYLKEQAPKP